MAASAPATASALIEQARELPYASPVRHGMLLEAIAVSLNAQQGPSRRPSPRKPPTSPSKKAAADPVPDSTQKASPHA